MKTLATIRRQREKSSSSKAKISQVLHAHFVLCMLDNCGTGPKVELYGTESMDRIHSRCDNTWCRSDVQPGGSQIVLCPNNCVLFIGPGKLVPDSHAHHETTLYDAF